MKDRQAISKVLLGVVVAMFAANVAIYGLIFFVVPQFQDLFASFTMDLPEITRFVFDSYKYYGLLALIGLYPTVDIVLRRKDVDPNVRVKIILVSVSCFVSLAVLVFTIVAVYSPVFGEFEVV